MPTDAEASAELVEMVRSAAREAVVELVAEVRKLRAELATVNAVIEELAPVARKLIPKARLMTLRGR